MLPRSRLVRSLAARCSVLAARGKSSVVVPPSITTTGAAAAAYRSFAAAGAHHESRSEGSRELSTAVAPQPDFDEDEDDDGDARAADATRPRLEELRRRLREEEGDGPPAPTLNGAAANDVRVESSSSSDTATSTMTTPSSTSTTVPQTDDEQTPSSSSSSRDAFAEILARAQSQLPGTPPSATEMLTDSYERHHSYLRISLAERCNLRCQYCMPPEGVPLQPKEDLLDAGEIAKLAGMFAAGGVDKVRLTGGEPLLRADLPEIISSIRSIPGINSVGITTNGLTLSRRLPSLIDAGLTHVNVSLDTLREDRFEHITRRRGLTKVLRAIDDAAEAFRSAYPDAAERAGRVKINNVVMRGFNDDELRDFAALTLDMGGVDVRFIEWMPFLDNGWNRDRFLGYADMMARVTGKGEDGREIDTSEEEGKASLNGVGPLELQRLEDGPNDTTKWWSVVDPAAPEQQSSGTNSPSSATQRGRLGFITSMSSHFCGTCNRLRLTADGKLKTCLFGGKEVSLRDAMRGGATEDELRTVVGAAVRRKTFALGGHGNAEGIAKAGDNRPMILIGG